MTEEDDPAAANAYLDENVSRRIVPLLSARGIDAIHARFTLPERTSDHLHLAFAARTGRVLITHDEDDFLLLSRAWRDWSSDWVVTPRPVHPGILVIPQQPVLSLLDAAELVAGLLADRPTRQGLANRCLLWSWEDGWNEPA